MEKIDQVSFKVTYNNKDISTDLSKNLLSINYKDNTEGKPDELTLALENVDAFWENEWYPEKGAKITCDIGYEAMMSCGTFSIDEIEINSIPDVVQIKAISVPITGKLRTSKSTAHENTTLKDIVNKVASDNGLTVQGEIGDLSFVRITQNEENDLAFLKRLADRFGFYFSIRGTVINFNSRYELVNKQSIAVIDRADCKSYSIRDKSAKTFRKANITSFNPNTKKLVTYTITPVKQLNADGISYETIAPVSVYYDKIKKQQAHEAFLKKYPNGPAGYEDFQDSMTLAEYIKMQNEQNMQMASDGNVTPDMGVEYDEAAVEDALNIRERLENEQQAEAVGSAALLKNNLNQQEGSITIPGNTLFVAGNNFQFTGVGKLSGKYHISASEHSITKSGYVTTIEMKRVGFIELSKGKRKKGPVKKNYTVTIVK